MNDRNKRQGMQQDTGSMDKQQDMSEDREVLSAEDVDIGVDTEEPMNTPDTK